MTKMHFALPLLAAAALTGAMSLSAAAQTLATPPAAAVTAPVALTGAARSGALTRASAALNRVTNMQGRFTQIAPDGTRSAGVIYLSRGQGGRMGRLRFEYDAPSQFLVVADGVNVATIDRALKSTTRVGIGETPLQYLLKPNISLERDTTVSAVTQSPGALLITVRDRTNKVEGALTLAFDPTSYALKAWEVTDGARNSTRLTLTETRATGALSARLFVIEDLNAGARRPPR